MVSIPIGVALDALQCTEMVLFLIGGSVGLLQALVIGHRWYSFLPIPPASRPSPLRVHCV